MNVQDKPFFAYFQLGSPHASGVQTDDPAFSDITGELRGKLFGWMIESVHIGLLYETEIASLHPFTAPSCMPLINQRWQNTKTPIIGISINTDPAQIRP